MPQYSHVEWDEIPYVPGSLHALAYMNGSSSPAAEAWRNTSGPVAALQISVKDDFGTQLIAGCADVALVQVRRWLACSHFRSFRRLRRCCCVFRAPALFQAKCTRVLEHFDFKLLCVSLLSMPVGLYC
jgi:hypothetical protein